jgi:hypothetical protein
MNEVIGHQGLGYVGLPLAVEFGKIMRVELRHQPPADQELENGV